MNERLQRHEAARAIAHAVRAPAPQRTGDRIGDQGSDRPDFADRVRISIWDWLDTLWFAIGIALVASLMLIGIVLVLTLPAQAQTTPSKPSATATLRPETIQGPHLTAGPAAPGTRNVTHLRELTVYPAPAPAMTETVQR